MGIKSEPTRPRQVKLANGEIFVTDHYVPQLEWWTQGHCFSTDMKVLELGAYDAILGYDWLKAQSPINHHWGNRTMELSTKVFL